MFFRFPSWICLFFVVFLRLCVFFCSFVLVVVLSSAVCMASLGAHSLVHSLTHSLFLSSLSLSCQSLHAACLTAVFRFPPASAGAKRIDAVAVPIAPTH